VEIAVLAGGGFGLAWHRLGHESNRAPGASGTIPQIATF